MKFVPDWLATNKLLKELDAIFSNDYIVLVNEDANNVTFLVKIWVLILYNLTFMIMILTMMILKLLSMLDSWLLLRYKQWKACEKKISK